MIISLSHQKGGVAKSTLLWNLVVEFSKERLVKVIDLDIQKTVTYSMQIRNNLNKKNSNIELINIESLESIVKVMQKHNKDDLLFIDSGGFDSDINRIAIAGSDIIVTPVSSKFYELLGLKK